MTRAQIAKATDAAITERIEALQSEMRPDGLTRKGWNEWHNLHDERQRRNALMTR